MNPWGVLEIEPTNDASIIKKAYAKKLKVYHPEDDPEGYQRLRESFDTALKLAKQLESEPVVIYTPQTSLEPFDDDGDEDEDDFGFDDNDDEEVFDHRTTEQSNPVYVFLQRVEELYDDFFIRIDPESWKPLLEDDIVWDIERSQVLQHGMISFLEDYHHLPREVWVLIEDIFHFCEKKQELKERYREAFIDYMIRQIEGSMELRYDCFHALEGKLDFEIEEYLDLRESAQSSLMENNPEVAKEYLSDAEELFAEDPDLHLLKGIYYVSTGDRLAALECFNRVITLEPDNFDGHWHRAQILLELKRFVEALEACAILIEMEPKNQDLLVLIGRCHFGLRQIPEAKKAFRESCELNHKDNYHLGSFIYFSMAVNEHLNEQRDIDPAELRRVRKANFIFGIGLYLRLTWLYILVYLVLLPFIGFQPIIGWGMLILMLWNLWKVLKAQHVLST